MSSCNARTRDVNTQDKINVTSNMPDRIAASATGENDDEMKMQAADGECRGRAADCSAEGA